MVSKERSHYKRIASIWVQVKSQLQASRQTRRDASFSSHNPAMIQMIPWYSPRKTQCSKMIRLTWLVELANLEARCYPLRFVPNLRHRYNSKPSPGCQYPHSLASLRAQFHRHGTSHRLSSAWCLCCRRSIRAQRQGLGEKASLSSWHHCGYFQ